MTEGTTDDIVVERRGKIDLIRLNRPDVRNALRMESFAQLEQAVLRSTAHCIVITGRDPAFCSGDDVRAIMLARQQEPVPPRVPSLFSPSAALLYTNIPVIAAVNGAAVGWGAELALMADFRVASERARFGQLFVQRGLLPGPASLARLVQLVGREVAAELLMTGEFVDAERAARIGMVGRVVSHAELLPAALELAGRIATAAPLAVRAVKAGLREAADPDWATLGRWVTERLDVLRQSDDHAEGVRAFVERRPPEFAGH